MKLTNGRMNNLNLDTIGVFSASNNYINLVKLLISFFILITIISFTFSIKAQVTQSYIESAYNPPGSDVGAPAGSYSISNIENVNLANGNLSVNLPLMSVGGRGESGYTMLLPMKFSWRVIHYQTYQGYPVLTPIDRYKPVAADFLEMGYDPGKLKMTRASKITGYCQNATFVGDKVLSRLYFTGPGGTSMEFYDVATGGTPANFQGLNCTSYPYGRNRGKVWIASDGSGTKFVFNNDFIETTDPPNDTTYHPTGELVFPNGVRYKVTQGDITEIIDRNGNKTSFTYNASGAVTSITDSINRVVTISYGTTTPGTDTITFKGTGGATRTIKVGKDYKSNLLQTGYSMMTKAALFPQLPDAGTGTSDPSLIAYVELPDGRKYNFKYNSHGDIARLELPTGGAYEYEWTGMSNGPSRLIARWVTERRTYPNGGTGSNYELKTDYNYTNTSAPFYTPAGQTTVTQYEKTTGGDQVLAVSKHFSNPISWGSGDPFTYWDNGYQGKEYKTELYDTNGTSLLRKIEHTYAYRTTLTTNSNHQVDYRLTSTKTTLADISPNLISKQDFSYDSTVNFNRQTDIYEYDYGSGTVGAFKRRSHTDYLSTNPNQGNADYLDESINLLNLPSVSWVSSNTSGSNKVSYTSYEYDKYTGTNHATLTSRSNVSGHDSTNYGTTNQKRGNVTAITAYTNALNQTGAVNTFAHYDILGNVIKSIDANGNSSTIGYIDRFGTPNGNAQSNTAPSELNGKSSFAFATSLTNSKGWISYVQNDFYTGQMVDAEDIHGIIDSTFYNDSLDRPTKSITANNLSGFKSQIVISYDDVNNVVTKNADLFTFEDGLLQSKGFYDGFGRIKESRRYEPDGEYISIQAEYDALGRVKKSTNPYRPLQSETQLWTEAEYDALGRNIEIKTPDNAVSTTSYDGNSITVTDQSGKKRRSITNAIGQLTRIDEPNSSGNLGSISSPNQATSYTYDSLNNLLSVSQGIQTRTFTYDSLSRLKTANNPESGTITYTYDPNGNILTRKDNRNITTTYNYDSLNRILTKSYTDSTPTVTYTYDNLTNSKGLLTKMSSSISTTEYTSFDVLGRVLAHKQTTDGIDYTTGYTYNLAGMVLEETYPSGRKVRNTFDNIGRLSEVETKSSSGSYQTRISDFSYTSHGAISSAKLGNNRWESTQFNNRLQPTRIALGTTQSGTNLLKLDFTYGTTNNNGNILTQTITIPTAGGSAGFTAVQTYTYDELNRLKSAVEKVGSSQKWKQTFTYDRYGNRRFDAANTTTISGCPPAQCNPTIDISNNRFSSGQGYTYDLSGNVISDAEGKTFTFDANNKQKEAKNSFNVTLGTYFYDGNGKRVKKITATENIKFIYNIAGKLVEEYKNQNTQPELSNIYAGNRLLSIEKSSSTSYLTKDHLKSPRILTNQSGTVESRRDFTPFGEELYIGVGNRQSGHGYTYGDSIKQKFTGYERDSETGLDFAQARMYKPLLGRFSSPDTPFVDQWKSQPQSWNLYNYVRNNPLNSIDPKGRSSCDPLKDPNCPSEADVDDISPITDVDGKVIPGDQPLIVNSENEKDKKKKEDKSRTKNSDNYTAPLDFGLGWRGRVDPFDTGQGFEIHIYDPSGEEVGIVSGKKGWIRKHGHQPRPPANIPDDVLNKINGENLKQLRKRNAVPPKGKKDVKAGKYLSKGARMWNVISFFHGFVYDAELYKRAQQNGRTYKEQFEHEARQAGPYLDTVLGPMPNPYYGGEMYE